MITDTPASQPAGIPVTARGEVFTGNLPPQPSIEFNSWQKHPLEPCYPFVWLGKTHHKIRSIGHVSRCTACTVLGLDTNGNTRVLGIYACQSEGAGFWRTVLDDLAGRGVKDILIAIVDGLNGFPEASARLFPHTDIQLRILYQIRNSMKYVSPEHQKAFMADLKPVYDIYSTQNRAESEHALEALEAKWGRHYPVAVQTWRNKWANIATCFNYPPAIREIIYATNTTDSAHRQFRLLCEGKDIFSSEYAVLSLLLTACQTVKQRWTVPHENWREIHSALGGHFTERFCRAI